MANLINILLEPVAEGAASPIMLLGIGMIPVISAWIIYLILRMSFSRNRNYRRSYDQYHIVLRR